jgi:4-amino-4-deoxy-L-arabinose transferase-like glycosyltransferase
MDAILTSCIAFATWQLVAFRRSWRWRHVVLASLAMALGFATKGMVGIAVPAISLAVYLADRRDARGAASPRWLLAPALVAVFAAPVLWCYWRQFGARGLEFILFSQSAERLTKAGGDGDPLFFVHTLAWAYLPWSLLAFVAWWRKLRELWSGGLSRRGSGDLLPFGTVTAVLVIISCSRFKLPHYLDVLLPALSILTASDLLAPRGAVAAWRLERAQTAVVAVALATAATTALRAFGSPGWPALALLAGSGAVGVALLRAGRDHRQRIGGLAVAASLALNLLLNLHFFPHVLAYQAGTRLAQEVLARDLPLQEIAYVEGGERSPSFELGIARLVPQVSVAELRRPAGPRLVYTGEAGLRILEESGIAWDLVFSADHHHVSTPRPRFLRPSTRALTLERQVLVALRATAE